MYKATCTYCIAIPQTVLEVEEGEEIDSQYSQLDLFPEVGCGEFIMGDTLNEDEAMEEEEPMEVVMSQEITFSQLEFIPSDGSHSQDEASSSQETSITTDNTTTKQGCEEKLKQLLCFSLICDSSIITENTVEAVNRELKHATFLSHRQIPEVYCFPILLVFSLPHLYF
ncbi:hypothetical protein P5673_020442 [Acropora cervicornis]|uniref:Uncharacterized protein n=1 Tax=Acropora cervicornis TaxID=6130 RepID=A0AAD9Q9Q3_ACRCE|nr:hypothetical protein P5673_020442 [Acropora cervicornis]